MNEIFQHEVVALLLRISLVLLVGCAAIAFFRKRAPSLTIVISRFLLLGMWIAPLLILSGWTIKMPVLPNDAPVVEASKSRIAEAALISSSSPEIDAQVTDLQNRSRPSVDTQAVETSNKKHSIADVVVQPKAPVTQRKDDLLSSQPSRVGDVAQARKSESVATVNGTSTWFRFSTWLTTIWLVVASILLSWFVIRIARTALVIRRSEPSDDQLSIALERVAKQLAVRRIPSICVSSEVAGPCTVGWFRPILLFPAKWLNAKSELTKLQTEMILAHELTHARSHDATWDAIGQVTRALWWFHPLLTFVIRQHRLACEHRCDAAASQIAGDVESYRRQLARWALAIRDEQDSRFASYRTALISLSMAQRPLMLKRLSWLKTGRLVERLSFRTRLIALTGIALMGTLGALVQPVEQLKATRNETDVQQETDDSEPKDSQTIEDNVIIAQKGKFSWSSGSRYELDWENFDTVSCAVKNAKGEPVPGAFVELTGLSDHDGDSISFFLEGGTAADEHGKIKIKLPTGTRSFRLEVKAENYVTYNGRSNLAENVEVKMKSGRIVRVRATNDKYEMLPNIFPMVENCTVNREFQKQPNGTHVSPLLAPDRRWMWVVDGSNEHEPILFSDLIDLHNDMIVDEEGFVHPQLSIGTRLEGVLGDEVPRPIENGFVHVYVIAGENDRRSLEWKEHTRIKPDGTFVFESLPRDTHAQIFAICDGWQSTSPSRESVEAYNKKHVAFGDKRIARAFDCYNSKPQLCYLDSLKSPVQVKVPCRTSTALDVRVVDPSGNPIEGAKVSMSPNLAFFGDLVIPGWQMYTNDRVRKNGVIRVDVVVAPDREPEVFPKPDNFAQFATKSYLDVKTDAAGLARVRNLPNLSDSFKVEAKGYVMSAYPTSSPEDPGRYGLTGDMTPGKTKKMTITMERELKPIGRELTVVDQDGKPLKDIRFTITAIASDAKDPDWQQWSERRFGASAKGKTDSQGNVRLLFPQQIADGKVALLTVKINGSVGQLDNERSVNETLVIPAKPDGFGIQVTTSEPTEEEKKRAAEREIYVRAPAVYADILSSGASAKQILQNLVERQDLVSLKQLLQANQYALMTPLELNGKMNQTMLRRMGGITLNGVRQNGVAIEKFETPSGERVVALASVRPKGAKWDVKPPGSSPPEAALIFDEEGTLSAAVGVGTTLSNRENDVALVNLGGTKDFFVQVTEYDSPPPLKYSRRWYKVDEPGKPALSINYLENMGGSIPEGTKSPSAEYGFLGHEDTAGKSESGMLVPYTIIWDHSTGKFYGEQSQTFDGKPGYQVVVEESEKFESVSTKQDEITVAGGRGDFRNWHHWRVVVPEGQTLSAKLELRDAEGKTLRLIREDRLGSGQHDMQLQFGDTKPKDGVAIDPNEKTFLKTGVDVKSHKEIKNFGIPHFTADESPTLKDHVSYFTTKPPLRIIEKQSTDKKQKLVWIIE